MGLLRHGELAPARGERIYRQSSVEACALLALLLSVTAGCAAAARAGGSTGVFAALLGLPSLGATGLALADLLRARQRRGWALRVRSDGIAIEVGGGPRQAEASILWLPREALASAGRVVEAIESPDRRGTLRVEHRVTLELRLRGALRPEILQAIQRHAARGARMRRRPRIEVLAPDRLRIPWRSHGVRLSPGIETAVEAVEALTNVRIPAALERTDFQRLAPGVRDRDPAQRAAEGRQAQTASILRARNTGETRPAKEQVTRLLESRGRGI